MTIALVSDCYLPTKNGVSRSVALQRGALLRRGHRVVLIVPAYPGAATALPDQEEATELADSREAPIYRVPSLPFRPSLQLRVTPAFPSRLARIFQEEKVEIVHTHTEFTLARAAKRAVKQAARAAKQPSDSGSRTQCIPLVHTYHTFYEHYLHYAPFGTLFRKIAEPSLIGGRIGKQISRLIGSLIGRRTLSFLKEYDRVICPSRKSLDHLANLCDWGRNGKDNPGIMIPNGIRIPQTQDSGCENSTFTPLPGIPGNGQDGRKLLLSVGRLGPEKRPVELLRALLPLLREDPDISLLMVGDGPERVKIKKILRRTGMEDRVGLPGFLPHGTVRWLYRQADMYVSASLSENHPLTLLEAAAAGLPLIVREASDSDGILRKGENGFLAEKDEEIRQAARELVSNECLRREYSRKSIEISKNFDIDCSVKNLEVLYSQLITQHKNL
jgi:1,2-diacylglycerol 3-alpha-glucosyltransferase